METLIIKGYWHYFINLVKEGLAIDLKEAERWAKLAAEKEGAIGLCTLAALSLENGKVNRGQFFYDEAYLHSNLLASCEK